MIAPQLFDAQQRTLFDVLILSGACITLYWVFPLVYGLILAPTKNVPGPFWARVTRWFEYRAVYMGKSNLQYRSWHEKYGSIVRVGPNRYSFNAPADVKKIYELGGNFTKTSYYTPLQDPEIDKQNIFTLTNPVVHKDRRRKIANLYSMSSVVSYEDAVDRMTEVCLRKFTQFAREERGIDVGQFMQFYAFDVIGEITFNRSFNMMEAEKDDTNMTTGVHAANTYLGHIGIIPQFHQWIQWGLSILGKPPLGSDELLKFAYNQLGIYKEAEQAAPEKTDTKSFLGKMLQMEVEGRVQMPHVMDTCGSNITAGSDTTAISLSSTLYYLYKDADVLAKLRREIDTMAADGLVSDPVTYREAQAMPYLQAVIKEALRMHPAVGTMLARTVPKGGVQLGGVYFPEGTEVGANAWALHFNEDTYGKDANVFQPERWLSPKSEGDLKEQMLFSFGGGSRTCIGKNISLLEMTKVLPQIVRHFDLEIKDKDKPVETYCAWFVYFNYNVKITPRKL